MSFLFDTVFFVELVNTAAGLCRFLLSCVERMALGADFHVNALVCGTCDKCVSAVAGYSCLIVFGMYSFAHDLHLSILKLLIILSKQLSHCSIRYFLLQYFFI